MEEFVILSNNYLSRRTKAYYTFDYYAREDNENTSFILDFKNTFANFNIHRLNLSKEKAKNILKQALTEIIEKNDLYKPIIVAVPRAKALDTYKPVQLYLLDTIREVAQEMKNTIDGTNYIRRIINTKTTHLSSDIGRVTRQGQIFKGENANDGSEPYVGITKDTCSIFAEKFKGRTVILIDDIYTKTVNIDEDCIQAIYEAGAREVYFYAFAKTARR